MDIVLIYNNGSEHPAYLGSNEEKLYQLETHLVRFIPRDCRPNIMHDYYLPFKEVLRCQDHRLLVAAQSGKRILPGDTAPRH